jgi:microsomal dipeptidase-like Zn-dependent dipeptidase
MISPSPTDGPTSLLDPDTLTPTRRPTVDDVIEHIDYMVGVIGGNFLRHFRTDWRA